MGGHGSSVGDGRICLDGDDSSIASRSLRPIERALLRRLHQEHGGVVTREQLLDDVWGYARESRSRTLATTVTRLRRRLGDASGRLTTVHGVGYVLERPPPVPPDLPPLFRASIASAARWIDDHPGGWMTLVGSLDSWRSAVLQTLARRGTASVRVYVDVEIEGLTALQEVLDYVGGPRRIFADLGTTDPSALDLRGRPTSMHTVVVAARAALDDRHEAVLRLPVVP